MELYKLEAEGLVKMSKLMEVSVYPKPIETECSNLFKGILRRVHCYHHPGMRNVDGREHTAAFIKIVVNWWKIVNVKSIGIHVRFNNKLQLWYKSLLTKG